MGSKHSQPRRMTNSLPSRKPTSLPASLVPTAKATQTKMAVPARRQPSSEYEESIDLDELLEREETTIEAPKTIDARWGDHEDVAEEVCAEFKPNLFRKGFCMNCQKQHEATVDGTIKQTKIFTKIHQAPTSPHAAKAELNPSALPEHSVLSAQLSKAREEAAEKSKLREQTENLIDELAGKANELLQQEHLSPNAIQAKLYEIESQLDQVHALERVLIQPKEKFQDE